MTLARQLTVFFAAALVLCSTLALAPAEAEAADILVGAAGKFGGSTLSIDSTPEQDIPFGIGGGAQAYAAYKIIPTLAVGLNFDWTYFSHSEERTVTQQGTGNQSQSDVTFGNSQPSFGLLVRSRFTNTIAAHFWGNYAFGSVSFDDGVNRQPDDQEMSGFQLGLMVMYQFKIGKYKTWVEPGLFATYGFLTIDQESQNAQGQTVTTEFDTSRFTFGASIQGSFEIGL